MSQLTLFNLKTCMKCGSREPLWMFYKHPQMRDGHLNKCIECTKSDVRIHYRATRSARAEYERKRYQEPDRRAYATDQSRKVRARHPNKYAARNAVGNAVRDGRLVKAPCEVCGSLNVEAHHEDYSKPLDVNWLCRDHHLERHGKRAY